jgi:hypothetical protein
VLFLPLKLIIHMNNTRGIVVVLLMKSKKQQSVQLVFCFSLSFVFKFSFPRTTSEQATVFFQSGLFLVLLSVR